MSLAEEQVRSKPQTTWTGALSNSALLRKVTYKHQLWLLLLPYLFGLFLLVVLPALLSIPFAFTQYNALSEPKWIGFDNFSAMFRDDLFWNGLSVSLLFIAVAVPLRVLGAVFLAFLLHKATRANRFFRSIVYLPTIVPDVAYALLWIYIFNPLYGPLNWILPFFGQEPHGWLLEPGPAKFAIILMMLLPIGEGFVLMLAAFHDIPNELQESAAVDGATGRQRFTHITLPLLAPAILLLFLRDTVLSFHITFVPALITTHAGPYNATRFLPFYIYQSASEYQQYGYAAAMTWIMYGVTAVVIALQVIVARRWRNALNAQ